MLDGGPGDGEPVEGGRAAPDFVENHEGARPRLIEDGRRLHHFYHEGGAPARQVVGGPHPAEQPFDDADRSEEHTSELQSLMRISYAVFCLKKKNNDNIT